MFEEVETGRWIERIGRQWTACTWTWTYAGEVNATRTHDIIAMTAEEHPDLKNVRFRGVRRAALFRFFTRQGPANPSEVGVHFFGIFLQL